MEITSYTENKFTPLIAKNFYNAFKANKNTLYIFKVMFNRLNTLKLLINLSQVFTVRVAAENGQ